MKNAVEMLDKMNLEIRSKIFKNEMIITFGPELLRYYDLKGVLFKEECLQKPISIVKDSYYSIVYDANNNISVFKSR